MFQSISGRLPKRGRKSKERIDESENVQTTPTRTYCKRCRPLPYCNPNSRTPWHWKFTQHHRTTRPPLCPIGPLNQKVFSQSQPPLSSTIFAPVDTGVVGGAMVLGKLPVPGRPTILITVGQGPIALAVGAGGVVWTFLL